MWHPYQSHVYSRNKVSLDWILFQHQYSGRLRDLKTHLAQILGLRDQLKHLRVKVHKEFLGFGMTNEEGWIETGTDRVDCTEPASVVQHLKQLQKGKVMIIISSIKDLNLQLQVPFSNMFTSKLYLHIIWIQRYLQIGILLKLKLKLRTSYSRRTDAILLKFLIIFLASPVYG